MNAADRKSITELQAKADALIGHLEEIESGVRSLADAERQKFENMTEGLQQAEGGQAIDAAANALSEAADAAETAKEAVEEIASKLDEASV